MKIKKLIDSFILFIASAYVWIFFSVFFWLLRKRRDEYLEAIRRWKNT